MTDYEIISLEFFSGKISFKETMEQIVKLPRPWTTKEWQVKRELILKPNCENCGTTKDLQIQHLKHPKRFIEIQRIVIEDLLQEAYNAIQFTSKYFLEYLSSFIKSENSCPNCFLKATKSSKCPKCKQQISKDLIVKYYKIPSFKNLSVNEDLDEKRLDTIKRFYKEKRRAELRNELWLNKKIYIRKLAFKYHYLENIRYLSFVDTKTACKKCSAQEDYVFIKMNELKKEIL